MIYVFLQVSNATVIEPAAKEIMASDFRRSRFTVKKKIVIGNVSK